VLGDFNSDDRLDLVVADVLTAGSFRVSPLMASGDGTFTAQTTTSFTT